jgi:hypothetical protein
MASTSLAKKTSFKSWRRFVTLMSKLTAQQSARRNSTMRTNTNSGLQRASATLLAVCLLVSALAWIAAAAVEIPSASSDAVDSLKIHARYLASDELTGRGVDTPGIKLARDYIAREFARYGLRPGGDNGGYLQSFHVATGIRVTQPSLLSINDEIPLELDAAWIPLGFSKSTTAEGDLVFAGYGITAKEYGYDDYDGIDAQGKVVMVLRYEPPPKDAKSPFRKAPQFSSYATLRAKANNARDHGASAMILVDLHYEGSEQGELISPRASLFQSRNSIVAVQVKRRVAERWLEGRGTSLATLKEMIDRTERPASMALPDLNITIGVTLEQVREPAENIVGLVPGADPRLENEHVIIGAHYDHLGFGHYGTRDLGAADKIHHGADDNASGIAVLLRVAEQLAEGQPKSPRTIVFVAFSAEELGLYGSRHYANHPSLPLSSARAMINLDMVGRLQEDRVTVFGARSARELSGIVTDEARKLGLEIRESDGIGRSDHMSFYSKKVPVLHLFTGIHADYHRPGDTWEKLNYEGMKRIAALVAGTAQRIADAREPFEFVALPARRSGSEPGERPTLRTYLGSIPDYDSDNKGVRLAGVSPGSPAALAGLRAGDVITEFAGKKIQNIEDLMGQLSSKKPGDEVEIVILRASLPWTVKAKLAVRN